MARLVKSMACQAWVTKLAPRHGQADKGHGLPGLGPIWNSIPKIEFSWGMFLQTPHCRHLTTMRGVHEIPGEFIYLGIASGLRKIISTQIYRENDISLLVHIDGMQVYRNAKKEIWPISIKIQHPNYTTKPFAAAIYCGDGKPLSATEFMTDFVEEANELQENGLRIDDKVFEVKIVAIVADSPARAFICCHKAPGAFYACGRCFTKGITVGCGRRGKRIYPVTNANLRTKVSYETRVQPEHHYEGSVSPLLSLDRFDLTKQVPLDLMHLFYSGNMKWLLDKWLTRSSAQRIKLADVRRLDGIMRSLKADIPIEFQRKEFDVNNISRWKASQFKFFLNYCGIVVLQDFLPKPLRCHFSLFVFASRILNSKEFVKDLSEYAGSLLKICFETLPDVYNDEGAQVLSWHSIIHVANDAQYFKIPLNELSAFWGESYIGLFKKLVHSSIKPLTQIINRLTEMESGGTMVINQKHILSDWVIARKPTTMIIDGEIHLTSNMININGLTLTTSHPNNVVLLDIEKVFVISQILVKSGKSKICDDLTGIYIFGHQESSREEAFSYPDFSSRVGIFYIKSWAAEMTCKKAHKIKHKCALLNVTGRQYAISLLH
ncbi:uncharacterized protein LOC135167088 [Diachasmimorpha longicaudata]|uniref:uncharacterized protein LOC135167088 n=1 Tax=Diachasmimorpha longicaudata TaxID=58733 RepID=UPI0030B905C0